MRSLEGVAQQGDYCGWSLVGRGEGDGVATHLSRFCLLLHSHHLCSSLDCPFPSGLVQELSPLCPVYPVQAAQMSLLLIYLFILSRPVPLSFHLPPSSCPPSFPHCNSIQQRSAKFSVKGQTINSLGFFWFCHCRTTVAIDNP